MNISNTKATTSYDAKSRLRNVSRLDITVKRNVWTNVCTLRSISGLTSAALACVQMMAFHKIVFLTLVNFVFWSSLPAADEVTIVYSILHVYLVWT